MEELLRRTWAQINLDAVGENIRTIKNSLAPGTKLCAVVKADCYGHGYRYTAEEMLKNQADWFAVSNLSEALQLREMGIAAPILILGYTPPEKAETLAYHDISQAVFSLSYAKALSERAVFSGIKVNAHIKIDTGMSRLGFLYHDSVEDYPVLDVVEAVCRLPGLRPEGSATRAKNLRPAVPSEIPAQKRKVHICQMMRPITIPSATELPECAQAARLRPQRTQGALRSGRRISLRRRMSCETFSRGPTDRSSRMSDRAPVQVPDV